MGERRDVGEEVPLLGAVSDTRGVTEASATKLARRARAIAAGGFGLLAAFVVGVAVYPDPGAALIAFGGVALLFLLAFAPYLVAPLAIFPPRTATRDGDVLAVRTLRGTRRVLLRQVTHVWARKMWGRDVDIVVVGLSGPGLPTVWLTWQTRYLVSSADWLRAQVNEVARRPGVTVTLRARYILGLPDAPSGRALLWLWIRSLALFLAAMAGAVGLVFGYCLALINRAIG